MTTYLGSIKKPPKFRKSVALQSQVGLSRRGDAAQSPVKWGWNVVTAV
jgi:hypothetical protein